MKTHNTTGNWLGKVAEKTTRFVSIVVYHALCFLYAIYYRIFHRKPTAASVRASRSFGSSRECTQCIESNDGTNTHE